MTQKFIRHSVEGFIVWDKDLMGNGIYHSDVAKLVASSSGEVVSAGFIKFDENNLPRCYGYSQSLCLGSRGDDTEALRKQWGLPPGGKQPEEG